MRGNAGTPQRKRSATGRAGAASAMAALALTVAVSTPVQAVADPEPTPPITCEPVAGFGHATQVCQPTPGPSGFTPAPEQPSDTGFTPAPEQPSDTGSTPAPPLPDRNATPVPERSHTADHSAADDTGAALEQEVAEMLGDQVIDRNREIEEDGRTLGEIDIETEDAIIEVTSEEKGKAGQIRDYVTDPRFNPEGKVVILYAPNYTKGAGKAVEADGALVARTPEELLGALEEPVVGDEGQPDGE